MRVGIIGLARSGRSAARLARARGHDVFASDAGTSEEVQDAAAEVRALGGSAETGGHTVTQLAACDGALDVLAVLADHAEQAAEFLALRSRLRRDVVRSVDRALVDASDAQVLTTLARAVTELGDSARAFALYDTVREYGYYPS